jgi:hypothetical protein
MASLKHCFHDRRRQECTGQDVADVALIETGGGSDGSLVLESSEVNSRVSKATAESTILSSMDPKFLYLTATGWTAIATIGNLASLLVLAFFNIRYEGAMKKQVQASMRQANASEQTLLELQRRYEADICMQERTAFLTLRETVSNAQLWAKEVLRLPNNQEVALKPLNWDQLVGYVAAQHPLLLSGLANITIELNTLENDLRRFVTIDPDNGPPTLSALSSKLKGQLLTFVDHVLGWEQKLRNSGRPA